MMSSHRTPSAIGCIPGYVAAPWALQHPREPGLNNGISLFALFALFGQSALNNANNANNEAA